MKLLNCEAISKQIGRLATQLHSYRINATESILCFSNIFIHGILHKAPLMCYLLQLKIPHHLNSYLMQALT